MNESCKNIREKIDLFLQGELTPEEAELVEKHASSCPECGEILRRERAIRAMFQSMEKSPAPEALRIGVMKQLRAEAGSGEGFRDKIGSLFTLPRLTILTGAAAALLMVFWGIRLLHPPPSTRSSFDSSPQLIAGEKVLSPGEAGPKWNGIETEDKKERNIAASRAMPSIIDESRPSPESPSHEFFGSAGLKSGEKETLESFLKKSGALELRQMQGDEKRYTFFITREQLDRLKQEIGDRPIRIVSVRSLGGGRPESPQMAFYSDAIRIGDRPVEDAEQPARKKAPAPADEVLSFQPPVYAPESSQKKQLQRLPESEPQIAGEVVSQIRVNKIEETQLPEKKEISGVPGAASKPQEKALDLITPLPLKSEIRGRPGSEHLADFTALEEEPSESLARGGRLEKKDDLHFFHEGQEKDMLYVQIVVEETK